MERWRCQNEVGTREERRQCPNEWERGHEQRGFAFYDREGNRLKQAVVCDACAITLAESLVNYVTDMMVSGVSYRSGEQLTFAYGS